VALAVGLVVAVPRRIANELGSQLAVLPERSVGEPERSAA
jgi:hypothetical protein